LRLELKAMKVDPETRQRVKVLAAEQGREMWELVRDLVNEAWLKRPQNQPPSEREAG
jgi:hypothetical protein